jgi:hypothetical protein
MHISVTLDIISTILESSFTSLTWYIYIVLLEVVMEGRVAHEEDKCALACTLRLRRAHVAHCMNLLVLLTILGASSWRVHMWRRYLVIC